MKIFLFFAVFFCALIGFGQNEFSIYNASIKQPGNKLDTTYIKDISDKLIIKINKDFRDDAYLVKSKEFGTYTILPNSKYNYFVSVDYRFFGFSVGLPKQWFENQENNNLNVKTTRLSLGFSFFFNKWMHTMYYNRMKGYYIKESKDFIPDWQEGITPYIMFPNYTVRRIGGAISYIANGNKFSHRSFSQQTQIQKKSAGSFIPSISYEYTYSTDSIDGFDEEAYDKGLTLTAAVAYQYNWVPFKNLNLSGGVSSGYGLGYFKSFDSEYGFEYYWEKKLALNFNLNLNYQWRNLFLGGQLSNLNTFLKEQDFEVRNSIFYQIIYIGYQFNAPKIVEKPTMWLEKKLF